MKNTFRKKLIFLISIFLMIYNSLSCLPIQAEENNTQPSSTVENKEFIKDTGMISDSTDESTSGSTSSSTDENTSNSTSDSTDESTSGSTSSSTDENTSNSTSDSTDESTSDSTDSGEDSGEWAVKRPVYVDGETEAWDANKGENWLKNWNYNTNTKKGFICLNYYTGSDTNIIIPGQICSKNGVFKILIKNMNQESTNSYFLKNNKYQTITNISFRKATCNGITKKVGLLSESNDNNAPVSFHTAFRNATNLRTADLSGLDTNADSYQAEIQDMSYAFQGCSNLYRVIFPDSSTITNTSYMFLDCTKLGTVYQEGNDIDKGYLDMQGFYTSKITTMKGMFQNCSQLTKYAFFSAVFNLNSLTDMSYMFSGCSSLDDDFFNTVSFTNTGNIQDMSYAFENCTSLQNPKVNFTADNVVNMSYMFKNCSNLKSIDLSEFHTVRVNNMAGMFEYCANLNYVNLSNATIPPNTDTTYIFWQDTNEKTPLLVILNDDPTNPLLGYQYDGDKRRLINMPFLDANGGKFPDTNTSTLYYIKNCAISKSSSILNIDSFKQWVNENTPSKEGTGFLDWEISGTNPNDASSVLDLLNTKYTAQWMDAPNTSSDNKKIPSSAALSMVYIPSSFNTGQVALKNSGEQSIPLTKTNTFNVGIRDQENSTSQWKLNAKLTWNSEGPIDNAYLQTTGTPNIKQNINDGVSAYNPSTDLQECNDVTGTSNAKITTVDSTLMSNMPNKQLDGVYDYNLGDISLILPNSENIEIGNYSATVTWNLVTAP